MLLFIAAVVGWLASFRSTEAGVLFAVDFDLEGVQGRLVGLGGQALGQAGVDGHEAGGIGRKTEPFG